MQIVSIENNLHEMSNLFFFFFFLKKLENLLNLSPVEIAMRVMKVNSFTLFLK